MYVVCMCVFGVDCYYVFVIYMLDISIMIMYGYVRIWFVYYNYVCVLYVCVIIITSMYLLCMY